MHVDHDHQRPAQKAKLKRLVLDASDVPALSNSAIQFCRRSAYCHILHVELGLYCTVWHGCRSESALRRCCFIVLLASRLTRQVRGLASSMHILQYNRGLRHESGGSTSIRNARQEKRSVKELQVARMTAAGVVAKGCCLLFTLACEVYLTHAPPRYQEPHKLIMSDLEF